MEFITSNLKVVNAKTMVGALKIAMESANCQDTYKIYWDGDKPYAIPYNGSKTFIKAYSTKSERGKVFLSIKNQYELKEVKSL